MLRRAWNTTGEIPVAVRCRAGLEPGGRPRAALFGVTFEFNGKQPLDWRHTAS